MWWPKKNSTAQKKFLLVMLRCRLGSNARYSPKANSRCKLGFGVNALPIVDGLLVWAKDRGGSVDFIYDNY